MRPPCGHVGPQQGSRLGWVWVGSPAWMGTLKSWGAETPPPHLEGEQRKMRRQARPALSTMAATSPTYARECECACACVLCREEACSMCAVKAGRNEA